MLFSRRLSHFRPYPIVVKNAHVNGRRIGTLRPLSKMRHQKQTNGNREEFRAPAGVRKSSRERAGSLRVDIDEKRPFRIDLEQAFQRLLAASESRHSNTSLVGYGHLF
jgi:hypothetical protein